MFPPFQREIRSKFIGKLVNLSNYKYEDVSNVGNYVPQII